jgi:hypothetical protein
LCDSIIERKEFYARIVEKAVISLHSKPFLYYKRKESELL